MSPFYELVRYAEPGCFILSYLYLLLIIVLSLIAALSEQKHSYALEALRLLLLRKHADRIESYLQERGSSGTDDNQAKLPDSTDVVESEGRDRTLDSPPRKRKVKSPGPASRHRATERRLV